MKTTKPRRRSLSDRYARKARKKQALRAEVDELLRLACEDVPLNSGYEEYGSGKYVYSKMSRKCGSVRVFRFRDHATCMQAMQLGMMHDTWPEEAMRSDSFGRC